jgi:hypothetical protein
MSQRLGNETQKQTRNLTQTKTRNTYSVQLRLRPKLVTQTRNSYS